MEEENQKLKRKVQDLQEQVENLNEVILSERNKFKIFIANDPSLQELKELKDMLRSAIIPFRPFIITFKRDKKKYALRLSVLHRYGREIVLEENEKTIYYDDRLKFQFFFRDNGAMIIKTFKDDFCFDVADASNYDPPEGTKVYLSKIHGNSNQRFSYFNRRIIASQNGQCVTYDPSKDYPFVMMNPSDKNEQSQLFKIKYIDTYPQLFGIFFLVAMNNETQARIFKSLK